ncbi:SWIM-type domain-containing protein [Citrus sinensis]|uniref:SWIM-type domain-containing protein n=1 Tax=Citrus sinensis TaxID=2711 RepID=A0ACB8LXZ6_CITSI|nr:SWIM-type domain-containing protein [Citrus sinensis]
MVLVRVPILFNGEWIEQNDEYKFKGSKAKEIMIPRSTTYAELVDKIAEVIDIDTSEFEITMKFKLKTSDPMPPVTIQTNDDVEFFLEEVASGMEFRNPLCITFERRSISTVPVDRQPSPRLSWEESHAFSSYVPPSFPILSSNNFTEVNEFVTEVDCLDEPPLAVDLALGDNTPAPISSRTSNNGHVPRINLLASSSNLLATEVSGDTDVSMVKEVFESKEALQEKLKALAVKKRFQFKTPKSDKDLLVVVCMDDNCKWRLRASRLKSCNMFEIRKYYNVHTCSLDSQEKDNRQASSKLVGKNFRHKFDGASSTYKPADIMQDFQKEFEISYHKAWRAREFAMEMVRGSPADSYHLLPSYMAMVEKKNPGSRTFIEKDSANNFKYCFMAIGSSLRGFTSCIRPVIAVDGTFMRGKYKGTLFIATSLDGNNQLYPVAFGVGDSENDASWEWFFMKLRESIGDVPNLVFIYDRHGSIKKAIDKVFPTVGYGICTHHLKRNVNAHFKEVDVGALFELAAKAYRPIKFTQYMNVIRSVSLNVHQYLTDAGYEKWARSHFEGRRYGIMTTNIAESMNSVLKEARTLPIHKLMDCIIDKLQEWFAKRRDLAMDACTLMTTWVEKQLKGKLDKSHTYPVIQINFHEFIVKDGDLDGHVDVLQKTCSCNEFQIDQFPCEHVVAVCKHMRNYSVYDLCAHYYSVNAWVTAYAESIYPVGPQEEWDVSEEVRAYVLSPPMKKREVGRPRTTRIPSQGEDIVHHKCSRCGLRGHNRLTCTAATPLSEQEHGPTANQT